MFTLANTSACPPLKEVAIFTGFARAVVEGVAPGRLWTDEDAAHALHDYGMSLVWGEGLGRAFPALVDHLREGAYRTRDEWLQIDPRWTHLDWDGALSVGESVQRFTRVNFQFDEATFRARHAGPVLPPGWTLKSIDEREFDLPTVSVSPRPFWKGLADFRDHGGGICAVRNGDVGAIVFSATRFDDWLEIGIETLEPFRGQGLACAVAVAMIEKCLANRLTPVWACRKENTGSLLLAQKLGFKITRELPYYRFSARRRATTGHPHRRRRSATLLVMNDLTRPEPKAATIYDVAKAARVSIKTVSLVINNPAAVSEATRARVLVAIEELSYRPNLLARGLASQRSFMLGLFCDGHAAGSNYIAQIQMAALTICQNEGYHLVVECIRANNPNLVAQVHGLMAQSRLAGVILTPPLSDVPDLIEALKGTKTPIARYSPEPVTADFIDVDIDNVRAAYEITSYLIGLGHKRIGFVRGRSDHADAIARFEGYRRALADAGLAFAGDLCAEGDFTYKSGVQAGDRLLSKRNRPTAIFASNDDMAGGVMASSLRFNLGVPVDLSVAGFDDTLFAHAMWPRLTTCRQPIEEMTKAVVSALIHPGETQPGLIRFPHKIIVRGSTAPPKNRQA